MMRPKIFATIACAAIALPCCGTAVGQTWIEVGDAPEDVPASQDTLGVGPLTNIRGTTADASSDWVDVYSIMITDPAEFYATTAAAYGNQTATSSFDTRLFLFSEDGLPLLANDDLVSAAPWQSLLRDPSTFPTEDPNDVADSAAGISLTAGVYLLAVTGYDNDPIDADGNILFSSTGSISNSNTSLHGPNPDAGPFVSWENAGETGDYVVELGGATYSGVPEPGIISLAALGLLAAVGSHRRGRG